MDIARALGGLGAAFKNEVPQFRERIRNEDIDRMAMDDRNMAMDDKRLAQTEKRQKTLFLDARVASRMFDEGDYGSIVELFGDRENLLGEDVNKSDSIEIKNLARAASNNPEAKARLGQVLSRIDNMGMDYGVIPRPEAPKPLSAASINQSGQVVLPTAEGGFRASQVEGFTPNQQDRAVFQDINSITRFVDTGERVPVTDGAMSLSAIQGGSSDMSILDQRAEEQSRLDRTIPPSLLRDLSPSMQAEAQEVWSSLGGGSASMTAYNALLKTDRERGRRGSLDQTLSTVFPSATNDELGQLRAIVDQAEDVETGMALATTTREQQKTNKKGREVQQNALIIAKRIRNNGDLNAVLGSKQGASQLGDLAHRNDPGETDAIVDIENLLNMLTADNLSMMTGVLSETDIQIIADVAGGGLNRLRSEGLFKADLDRIITSLSNSLIRSQGGLVITGEETPMGQSGAPMRMLFDAEGNQI